MGSETDSKYLLPRLLEIVAIRIDEFNIDVESLFSKFQYAKWLNWPEVEITSIRNYLENLWQTKISEYIDYYENTFNTNELLCSIAQCEEDLTSYLNYWGNLKIVDSILYMFDFLDENAESLIAENKLLSAFWEGRQNQAEQVIKWMDDIDIYGQTEFAFNFISENNKWRIDTVKTFIQKRKKGF